MALRSRALWVRRSITCWPFSQSRAAVGSSAKTKVGFFTSARPIATRCFSPPESCAGRRWALFDKPELPEDAIGPLAGFARRASLAPLQDDLQLLAGRQGGEEVVALEDVRAVMQAELLHLVFGHAQTSRPSAPTAPCPAARGPTAPPGASIFPDRSAPSGGSVRPGGVQPRLP